MQIYYTLANEMAAPMAAKARAEAEIASAKAAVTAKDAADAMAADTPLAEVYQAAGRAYARASETLAAALAE